MKTETQQGSVKSKIENSPALNFEIKIHEQPTDALEATVYEEATAIVPQTPLVSWLVLVAVLTVSAVYIGSHISGGWVPADDGILAQSALRVMQGQLPHRDFAEIYTGGLSMIHALAFRVFGVNLMSLRYCAFLFCLAWIPAGHILRISPPVVMEDEALLKGLEIIDEAIGETEKELLTRGVPCSRVQQFEDVAASDWAAAVSLFRVLDHPHLGPRPLYTVPWHRDGGPSFAADRSSPLLASSTVDVLRGILGCTTEDIEALAEAEVVDIGAKESP